MKFLPLTPDDLISLQDSRNRNWFCDSLALIDDLLCGFDPERLPPSFLPNHAFKQGIIPGDEALIVDEINRCRSRIKAENLADNIHQNLVIARELRALVLQDYSMALEPIRVFLSDLLAQYAVVIHPTIYFKE
jgi:hypothetical protein